MQKKTVSLIMEKEKLSEAETQVDKTSEAVNKDM